MITGASILIPGIVELTREIMGARLRLSVHDSKHHPRRTNIAKRPKMQFQETKLNVTKLQQSAHEVWCVGGVVGGLQ